MRSRASLAVAVLLVAAVFVAYGSVATHAFVNWDDPTYVSENAHVRQGLTRASVVWACTTFHGSNWHPLTWLSHMLDVELFGLSPAGHHLSSVALHALNGVLVFLAWRALGGGVGPAACVAALFALHPLRVESVAWVAERKDLLSGTFFLLALWVYAGYARRGGAGRYAALIALFTLGLMAKPMIVTLPFVLGLLDVWPLGRWHAAGPRARRRLVLEKVPLLILSAASSIVTLSAQREALSSLEALPLASRLGNALVAYLIYVAQTFAPLELACSYPHLSHTYRASTLALMGLGATAVLVAVTAVTFALRATRPYLVIGWLWFLGMLVPVIGIVQVGSQALADRYSYLPSIGLALILAWGGFDLAARGRAWRHALLALAALGLAAAALLTVRQVGVWRDSRTLFEHALDVAPDNHVMHNNLGNVFFREGDLVRAAAHYERALTLYPDYPEAHNNLGLVRQRRGEREPALERFEQALRLRPDYPEALNNLGLLLSSRGDIERARAAYERALVLRPEYAEAHNNLGVLEERAGQLPAARVHFAAAAASDPTSAEAHHNLGVVLERQGDLPSARAALERALALRPDYANAHDLLGLVLAREGRVADALVHFERALVLDPGHASAQRHRTLARMTLGRPAGSPPP